MRRRDIEERHERKRRDFAMRYASPSCSYAGLEDIVNTMSEKQIEAWALASEAKMMKIQSDMWKTMMPSNRVEVVMLKSTVMMMDVMGDGVPTEWGEPTKRTKWLYYWNDISESRNAETVLNDPMWSKLPTGSYFVSWTNASGTERHHIGDAEKFCMVVSAPRICDAFEVPTFSPITEEEEWMGEWDCEKGDTSE